MNRYLQLVLVTVATMTTACATPKHGQARLEAQARWSQVRGRVKLQLAEQHYDSGLFEDTIHTATESVALDPKQIGAYVLLAKANLELGRSASAMRALRAAEQNGLASPALLYQEGVILERRDRLGPAADRFERAHAADPTNLDYLVAQVESLVGLDDPAAALRILDENSDQVDDEATVAALGAHIAALVGDPQEACARYARAFSAAADNRLIAEELGRLLVSARRYEEALTILEPLVESTTDDQDRGAVRRALAISYLALGDPSSAGRALADYAPAHPNDTLAQLILAKAALATNDVLTAMRAVNVVQQREPDRPELWLVRAAVRFKRGDLAGAANDLHDFLANSPDDIDAHCLLAEVLQSNSSVDGARHHFEKALQIDPDCPWANAGLKALAKARPPLLTEPSPKLTSAADSAETHTPRP